MNPAPFILGAAGTSAVGGLGLAAYGALHPGATIFGPTLRRLKDSAALALTFDDGPNPTATPLLLDLLERNRVHATFFLIGRYVRRAPALAREIAARGHAIGNHTETHPSLLWLSRAAIVDELRRCQDAIQEAAGMVPVRMRPPFGYRGPQLRAALRETGLGDPVMWSAAAYDWRPQPAAHVIRRLQGVRGGDIVLLHDGDYRRAAGDRDHTVRAISHWLPRWRDSGLRFAALDVRASSAAPATKARAAGA